MKRKALSIILILCILSSALLTSVCADGTALLSDTEVDIFDDGTATSGDKLDLNAKSAILLEAETGTVLYSKNANEALPPASVTKIMTLLLVAEALDKGIIKPEQEVTVSQNAASMGGSQIFIKEGERFTVEELLKSTVIASANDAAVALAELICGTEAAFVDEMNSLAQRLGMKNTHFENATGLDDTTVNHLTSAHDIALMSRELIKHDIILKYSNMWQDEIRDGEFILTNTNRLVRYYQGCTGLKTGSTDKAGFCISATAKRDGMHLIAVVMGSPTRDERNNAARSMLDYGFANYALYVDHEQNLEKVHVKRGSTDTVTVYNEEFKMLVHKTDITKIEKKYTIPESIIAPCESGSQIGEVNYYLNGTALGSSRICTSEAIERISPIDITFRILSAIICYKKKL